MIKRVIYRIDSINETQFYYPFMSLSSRTSPQSISAARNKMEDIVRQKSCFWEEKLLTLHTYH